MGFFKRAFDFIRYPTHSRTITIIITFVLVAAISLTVYVAQQQQTTKQHAAGEACSYAPACLDPSINPGGVDLACQGTYGECSGGMMRCRSTTTDFFGSFDCGDDRGWLVCCTPPTVIPANNCPGNQCYDGNCPYGYEINSGNYSCGDNPYAVCCKQTAPNCGTTGDGGTCMNPSTNANNGYCPSSYAPASGLCTGAGQVCCKQSSQPTCTNTNCNGANCTTNGGTCDSTTCTCKSSADTCTGSKGTCYSSGELSGGDCSTIGLVRGDGTCRTGLCCKQSSQPTSGTCPSEYCSPNYGTISNPQCQLAGGVTIKNEYKCSNPSDLCCVPNCVGNDQRLPSPNPLGLVCCSLAHGDGGDTPLCTKGSNAGKCMYTNYCTDYGTCGKQNELPVSSKCCDDLASCPRANGLCMSTTACRALPIPPDPNPTTPPVSCTPPTCCAATPLCARTNTCLSTTACLGGPTVPPVGNITLVSALNIQDTTETPDSLSANLTLYNLTTNNQVTGAPASQSFTKTSIPGKQYSANIILTNLPQDKYFIIIRKDNMIAKAIFTVSGTTGTITVPTTILVFGDLNNDNTIDALDYSLFKNCWKKDATGTCASSDFNKTGGQIDSVDYNTWLRGFVTWSKEGL